MEFPQYKGQEIEPDTFEGLCVARFPATAPKEEIFAYYSERLRENGWEVEPQQDPEGTIVALNGRRDGYRYRVEYQRVTRTTPEGSTKTRDPTVFASVSDR